MRNPPMVIRFNVTPQTITDEKWFEPHDYLKKIDTAIVTRPDEFAWFEVKIYQNGTRNETVGWGGLYGIPSTREEVVLRNPGIYQLEFSGHAVTVASEGTGKKRRKYSGLKILWSLTEFFSSGVFPPEAIFNP